MRAPGWHWSAREASAAGSGGSPRESGETQSEIRRRLRQHDKFPAMSARGRFVSVLVAMVTAFAGFMAVGALPAAAAPRAVQYVALGDSYAAGTAAGRLLNCEQSTDGYPTSLLDLGGRIDLQANVACSGATTSQVVENQLPALPSDTRLVTLTVGAANLNLSDVLTACTAVPPAGCDAAIQRALGRLPMLGSDLTELYADVAEAAPKARIVVTGYPHLFEPVDPLFKAINAAIDQLNTTIEQAVSVANDADINIRYVDVTEAFAGHGIGADPQVPLFIFPPGPEAYHPTPAGYDAYADAIAAALPGGWFKQSV
jgi:lysophospholipase L1-like esterase